MKLRRFWYLILFICLTSLSILFNNCAPPKNAPEESSQVSAESTVEVVTDFSGKLSANFQYVSTDGKAWGYALDSVNKTKAIKVIFYANGPAGTGTYAGEIVAKEAGVGANAGHYFSFKVPSELANGKYQKLYAYGHEAKIENLIKPSPVTFVSYTPKAEEYFNTNIAPFVNSQCIRCHTWTYQAAFYGPLMTALPINGGSATNNRLIRKMSGLDGHSGGQFCTGGVNSGICTSLQTWWTQEFQ